jgi:ribosomal-protein-alanine N-acetyltransferase
MSAVRPRSLKPAVSDLVVRPLGYRDLSAVLSIERRSFPTPWSLAMFVLELSKGDGVCLAAERKGQLLGYLICARYDTIFHVMNVAVAPEWRRMGVATSLLQELYRRVGDPKARFTLEVRRSNAGAIALYEREGFRIAGIRRRYYQDNGEDAYIMWRTPGTLAGTMEDVPGAGGWW